jgi:hypothetical protein
VRGDHSAHRAMHANKRHEICNFVWIPQLTDEHKVNFNHRFVKKKFWFFFYDNLAPGYLGCRGDKRRYHTPTAIYFSPSDLRPYPQCLFGNRYAEIALYLRLERPDI